jgi:uncharacterized secreted protein with C-terminal beta-propeller domain
MRSAKFFRWIWRLNAVLILLVAAAALFGVIALFASEIRSNARQREAVAAAPSVTPNAEKKELRLGGLTHIEGTTVYRAELASARSAPAADTGARRGTSSSSTSPTAARAGCCLRTTR